MSSGYGLPVPSTRTTITVRVLVMGERSGNGTPGSRRPMAGSYGLPHVPINARDAPQLR
jgi:hypothetical protein